MPPPGRILIVEDEDVLAENLKTFLGRRTPEVRVARDAADAQRILESFTPDVVVVDYALPGIDGIRAYNDIVRDSVQPPGCVMITGHMTERMVQTAHQRGIRHVLCKPFSFAELQQMVDSSVPDTGGEFAPEQMAQPSAVAPQAPSGAVSANDRRRHERRRLDRRDANSALDPTT